MNKWKESFSIITIGVCFIVIVLFIKPLKNNNNEFITRIPKTTYEHYLFNASTLLKKILVDELFIHKDDVVIQKIRDLISRKTKTETKLTDLSIDFSAPLEVIRFKRNNKVFTALKFSISNPIVFDRNQKQLTKELIFREKNNGYWILGESRTRKSAFQKFILYNSFSYKLINDQSKHFISSFNNTKLEAITNIEFEENKIIIERKQSKLNQTYYCLSPQGFHLSTTIHSTQLEKLYPSDIGNLIGLKELEYFSLNYLGLNFTDFSNLPAIPKFEILMRYKNKISGDSITRKIIDHYKLPFESQDNNKFQFANESIRIKQLDTNQFIISTLDKKIELIQSDLNPFISGDPKNIIKISNAGWKGFFLELIPGFKASKNFLESTNKISTYRGKHGSQVICLKFEKKEDALHSLLKLVLDMK
jgi:hypothetical protein